MLILTRKKDESLQIGEDIKITVVNVGGGHVRLGIEAPRETPVHRSEIYQKIVDQGDANGGSEAEISEQNS